jgi:hypothetical protein
METAKVVLVTIVGGAELQSGVESDLGKLGIRGYTLARVDGRGAHGARSYGFLDAGNVRIETLVSAVVARQLLGVIARDYAGLALLAYAHEVEAVPCERFG